LRRLEADVFPEVGSKPIGDVTAPRLLAMARKIEARGAIDIARRSWQTCGQIFEYAVVHGALARNPAKDVRPGAALKPRRQGHYARVDAKEFPELLRKIQAYQGSSYTRFAMQLLTLTTRSCGHENTFDWRPGAARLHARADEQRSVNVVGKGAEAALPTHSATPWANLSRADEPSALSRVHVPLARCASRWPAHPRS